ncbi:hypothetical protein BDF14DRAFT_1752737 [Spinellus fusiger]|nr:hypothetical protein BDF14DRAFT_1752737 [Spinellus fusiger]
MLSPKSISKAILGLLVLHGLVLMVFSQTATNPALWQQPIVYNISDASDPGKLVKDKSLVAISQDFQVLNTGNDIRIPLMGQRILFDFSYCCLSTNMSLSSIEQLNDNGIQLPPVHTMPKIALVQRGYCNWSEKLSVLKNISSLNNLNVQAIILYDNTTYSGEAGYVLESTNGQTNVHNYTTPLPAVRMISSMTDNDIDISSLSMPFYFAPNSYGVDLKSLAVSLNANNTGAFQSFVQLTAFFTTIPWNSNPDSSSDDTDSGLISGRGYLTYTLAVIGVLAIIFILARWWITRRRIIYLRSQQVYENSRPGAQLYIRNSNHPLPVEIVNSYPVKPYTVGIVKNNNCAICLEDFVENTTEIRMLPCSHGFCVMCIDQWLTQKSTTCPVCKWDCNPTPSLTDDDEIDLSIVFPFESRPQHEAINMQYMDESSSTHHNEQFPEQPSEPSSSEQSNEQSAGIITEKVTGQTNEAPDEQSIDQTKEKATEQPVEQPIEHINEKATKEHTSLSTAKSLPSSTSSSTKEMKE